MLVTTMTNALVRNAPPNAQRNQGTVSPPVDHSKSDAATSVDRSDFPPKQNPSEAQDDRAAANKNLVRPTLAADTEVIEDVRDGMIPISPFAQKRAEVRSRRINWGAYLQSGVISQEQFDCIIVLDKYTSEKRSWIFRDQRIKVAQWLMEMIQSISKDDTIQYLLTLIDDCLEQDRSRIQGLCEFASLSGKQAWSLFLPLLNRTDIFIMHQTARIISKLACWSDALMENPELSMYIIFLKLLLRSTTNDYRETATRCLQMLLRIREYRLAFVQSDGIVSLLAALGVYHHNFQLQYQLLFCLWCLSFDGDICERLVENKVIPAIGTILANSLKEKVNRISLATLRNLLEKPTDPEVLKEAALVMIHSKIIRSLELMQKQTTIDPDFKEDIEFILEQLQKMASTISSYDEYVSELKSGHLEWSPVHKSEIFWRENVAKFVEGNYELLKILMYLLEKSKDPTILSVAIHDVGQFVRYYPRGKLIVDKLGGKERAMALLNHDDSNVRYQALMGLQKMMIHNWEFVNKVADKDSSDGQKN